MRAEPSENSEMVSQLLFGEAYYVLKITDNWLKISTIDCNYEGWIDQKLHNSLQSEKADSYLSEPKYFVKNFLLFITHIENNVHFPVFAGSSFPFPAKELLKLGTQSFKVILPKEKTINKNASEYNVNYCKIIDYASVFLEAPYLWGGRTPVGIDCSGFVQSVFKSINIQLPRDASQQVLQGETVHCLAESQAGDVAFFQNSEGNIIHTGILIEKNRIIHASGKVKIDSINEKGIFCHATNICTHHLKNIKRFAIEQ